MDRIVVARRALRRSYPAAVTVVRRGGGNLARAWRWHEQRRVRTAQRAAPEKPAGSERTGARRRSPRRPRCCRHTGRNKQVSLPLWDQIRQHQQAFSSLFAFADTRFNLAPQGEVRYVEGLFVSGDFFRVLGVARALGRTIGAEDDRPGCGAGIAVISHALWQREFGGASDILSRVLTTPAGKIPIVGVMPAHFFGVEVGRRFDVAAPLCASGFGRPDHWWLAVMGRLKPGWTVDQADAHLAALGPQLLRATTPPTYNAEQSKQFATLKFSVHDARNGVSPLRGRFESPLWLLLVIAGLVLLTACANVASLFLVRATAREPELALRTALGASRPRIIRQLLVEGLLIAVTGSVAGIVLARLAASGVMTLLSTRTDPIVLDIGADWRVLAFQASTLVLTTVAFALAPALGASRRARVASLGRVTASRERVTMRELLVGVQVALSVILVSAAGLFLVTLRNLTSLDSGFQSSGVLVANVFMNNRSYPPETRAGMQRELTARLIGLPGIQGAAHSSTPPLVGAAWDTVVNVKTARGEIKAESNRSLVSAGYFAVMQTPLITGRDFNDRDTPTSPKVAVVNEAFARTILGEPRPLGRVFADGADTFEVVGVVGNTKLYAIREDFRPIAYTAASQIAQPSLTIRFVLRTGIGMAATIDSVRRTVGEFNPAAAMRFSTMDELETDSLQRERLMASLSGFFGAIAIVLAAVGVYGVVAYTASTRRRDIGIRLALGASGAHVVRIVLGRTAVVVAAGLLLGLGLALPATAAARSLLFGVDAREPWFMALIVVVLGGSGLAAAALPTRRALRTDPVSALRAE